MTITVDVATENVRTGTGTPTTFSHLAGASGVVGVVIGFMHGTSTTNHFSSVTYGGAALTEIQTATDSATELGFSSLWFLGSGLTGLQGTQTVSYASGTTGDDVLCVCITLKAGVTSLQIASKGAVNTNTSGPSVALTTGSREGMGFAAYYFGGGTAPTAGTSCTAIGAGSQLDGTAFSARMIRQTTGGTASFTIAGVGNDDTAFAAMMVVEAGPVEPTVGNAAFTGYAPQPQITAPESPVTREPAVGSAGITGYAPAVIMGFVAALSSGSISTEGTGWVVPSVETATNLGGGNGGLLLGLNGLFGSVNQSAEPLSGAVTIAGQQVFLSLGETASPSAGSLALESTGWVSPKIETATNAGGGSGGLLLAINTLLAPSGASSAYPVSGTVALTGYAPALLGAGEVSPSDGAVLLSGFAPAVIENHIRTPSVGTASITGYAPEPSTGAVGGGGGYGGLLVGLGLNFEPSLQPSPSSGSLAFTGYAPEVTGTSGSSGTGLLMALGTLTQETSIEGMYRPTVGNAAITGYAPTVIRFVSDIGWDELIAGNATFAGTGSKNAIYDPKQAYPSVGAVAFTGYAPSATATITKFPLVGALSLNGYAPSLTQSLTVYPQDGAVGISTGNVFGYGILDYGRYTYGTPRLSAVNVQTGPNTGIYALIGYRPTITQQILVLPDSGAVSFTGHAPNLPQIVTPLSGSLVFAGEGVFAEITSPTRNPLTGSVGFTGYSVTLQYNIAALPSILRGGRAYIEIYKDEEASSELFAGNASISYSVGQMAYGDGDLIAGAASVSIRNWDIQAPATDGWSQQTDASDIWTEVTPNTDTWNG